MGATGAPKDARQEGGGSEQHGHLPVLGSGQGSLWRGEKTSILTALVRAKPRAKPGFPPAFQEPLWQEHGILAAGGTGPLGRGARGPQLRAPSSLVGLSDPRDQGELAVSGVDLGAWKSSLGQLQVLQVEVWGSLGWDAPEISHAQWV